LGRWLTTDPAGQYHSPYLGMGNNPISRIDPDGGQDCNCNGGFLKRLFGKIGGLFKNNFGRYRPLKPGTRRNRIAMSRNLPKGQGRRQNSGRDIVNPVSFNQMQGLMLQTIDMSVSLIKLPTIRNSQSSLQLESITLGNLTRPIIGGRASF